MSTGSRKNVVVLERSTPGDRDKDDIHFGEDEEQQDRELSDDEKLFLKDFPAYKVELEEEIRKLHALADDTDKAHRRLTKVNAVSNTVSVASDAMCILGLVLAPATAGGSLMFSAAAKFLGTAAGATSIVTGIWEYIHQKNVQDQAKIQGPNNEQSLATNVTMSVIGMGKNAKSVKKSLRALQAAKNNPGLAAAAKRLLNNGRVSSRMRKQVQKAFEGTTMVMKGGRRLASSAMTGIFLGMDLKALRENLKDLKEGTATELAEELRAEAHELERKLAELTELYDHLKQKEKCGGIGKEYSRRQTGSGAGSSPAVPKTQAPGCRRNAGN